jgi:hypothetical protein
LFQSSRALGVSEANASACMLSVPHTSTSHAAGSKLLLIMLMIVQGTTPKYSSIEVQHCTAVILTSVCFIQSSIT